MHMSEPDRSRRTGVVPVSNLKSLPLERSGAAQDVRTKSLSDSRKKETGATPVLRSNFARRDFLKLTTVAAAGFALSRMPIAAGPFTREDFDKLVPADKKLAPDWVKSLFARGEPQVYRGADLDRIGMPVGGLCAGQLYLGGDGRLWHWDIFNQRISTGAEHYAKPLAPSAPLEQGFAVRVKVDGISSVRKLDRANWREVSFRGEYPIGRVEYSDPESPLAISLEAYSPFIPLNTEDSSLPATLLEFTLKNTGTKKIEVGLAGWLENAVCVHSADTHAVVRRNRIVSRYGALALECSAEAGPTSKSAAAREDVTFDDFERDTYGDWTVEGTAFGKGPVEKSKVVAYQGDLGMHGQHAVNTHSSPAANDVGARDAATGKLISKSFVIERNHINFLIGGGAHRGKTCMNLLVGGKVVRTATGANDNRMQPMSWNVAAFAGQTAQIQIVDAESGAWGNIGVDDIVFSDHARVGGGPLEQEADFGTMSLALLDARSRDVAKAQVKEIPASASGWAELVGKGVTDAAGASAGKPIGAIGRELSLRPGGTARLTFALAWHFPNLQLKGMAITGRHYAARFASAGAVVRYVAAHQQRLVRETRRWRETWYDSTLPFWFLDRTMLNTSILATSTCHRFRDGRFYAWEGVGCCEGTCGHVWQYAHAAARLFPELERSARERADFGLALQPDGAIHFRGEHNNFPAIDAQAGTILRALREHQMSADGGFLKRNWPQIRRATQWLIAKDANADGIIESNQHNTLDTDWFGPVAWLSGLYQAALLAAEAMAKDLGDADFAAKCRAILAIGQKNLVTQLFDGEYFINKVDPKHLDAINSGSGCEIDQVFGQSWAFQVGLPRVLPERETLSALRSLWRYNFTPDAGAYRQHYRAGRWYAMAGEAGLLMCSFPRGDWDYAQAKGKGPDWAAGYFNECMSGFEYQVAGHMIWEGMLLEGLAITRALHDRYHGSRRNPWNEVECGDHYARSMASYGVYLAACGFEHHGPKGHIGFAPRLTPENFKCAFTSAEGWGSFSQRRTATGMDCEIALRWGRLKFKSLSVAVGEGAVVGSVKAKLDGREVATRYRQEGARLIVELVARLELSASKAVTFTVQQRS